MTSARFALPHMFSELHLVCVILGDMGVAWEAWEESDCAICVALTIGEVY